MVKQSKPLDEDRENWKKAKEMICKQDVHLGPYYSDAVHRDLKHLAFTLSRYKFVCKMLMYRSKISVCELGCQEALGALMFQQNTDLQRYVGIDLDVEAIRWSQENLDGPFEFIEANFFETMPEERFDAIISLDVVEHIQPKMEDEYCRIIVKHLKNLGNSSGGVAIIGTPNVAMSPYANESAKIAHINLYNHERLYGLCSRHFDNVFIFSMNDEVVHTGFSPMACYIFAVCTGKKS